MKKANWTEVKPTNVLVKTTVKYVATWVIDFNIKKKRYLGNDEQM